MNVIQRIIPVFLIWGLASCEYSEEDLKDGPGYFKCESNVDRPTLTFHTKTFSARRNLNSTLVSFTNLKDGKVYTLHEIEDRDYYCKSITREEAIK